jgi:hypothetical protein
MSRYDFIKKTYPLKGIRSRVDRSDSSIRVDSAGPGIFSGVRTGHGFSGGQRVAGRRFSPCS